MSVSTPNLIERMENLVHVLGEVQDHITKSREESGDEDGSLSAASACVDDAGGIAGEVLTMLGGGD